MEFLSNLANQQPFTLLEMFQGLLLAYVLGQVAAWVYMYTHTAVSYSQSFIQSIILLTVIISLGIMVIGNNLAIAFGLLGALAVIRFRNILKDTRDTSFIFFSLILGLATGTGQITLALMGTAVFTVIVLIMYWSELGARSSGNGYARFRVDGESFDQQELEDVMLKYCRTRDLLTQHYQEDGVGEIAYRLSMKRGLLPESFKTDISNMAGITLLSFMMQDEQNEI
ncbi:MAG: hypothetical protein COA73_00295 [Candidatus Hydrogenedentota bacterium]|nr:MAG: hypothetical protein COA73_00295 [Candidatus Hydrogenedentota bacterium]